ncbi:Secreted protein [Pseudomonas sp. IT-P218]
MLDVPASSLASQLQQVLCLPEEMRRACDIKEQKLLSDVIAAIASASLLAQFSVIASEGLRISCHRPRSVSLCAGFGRWINSATACGCSSP